MKRIFIALAVLCCFQLVDAQQIKSAADLQKAVESAEAAAANPKKAESPVTWLKVAQAYVNAYSNPQGAGWRGANRSELQMLLGNDKPISSEYVTINGADYIKDAYATRNYYYGETETLEIIEVPNPVYEDALGSALEAYKKAAEVDVKGAKTKDISAGIADVSGKYMEDAIAQYTFGNPSAASVYFEKAYKASEVAPYSKLDSLCLYNAGFTAWAAGENERAQGLFEKCIEVGYCEKCDAYAKLGDVLTRQEKLSEAKDVMVEGFSKFPENQAVLIGLINYYMTSGEDPDALFVLLDKAKENEPINASLYYVEGDIHSKLGHIDEAVASFTKASEINPSYEFGYIGIGMLYYNLAVEYSEKASAEMDWKKYDELAAQFEEYLEAAFDPFESAFNISKDNGIKETIAEYLKNISYRFQSKDNKYKVAYEKYSEISKNGL